MSPTTPVRYELADGIAAITMDDGKANLMTETMIAALHEALDHARADDAVVLLTGRERTFSGGYDRGMFGRSPEEVMRTLRAGAELVWRLFGFPRPVVAACNGHAVAQGGFLLLATDVRIGAAGNFKIGLNEVAIGLTMPQYGIEIARARLATPWLHHATLTGTLYPPEQALAAGFLDRTVEPAELAAAAREEAMRLALVDRSAHAGTKQRVRGPALAALRDAIDHELRAV
ncbi:MAG: crotonase/enoyl-CoA hydratase family protein [bacterium]